MKFLNLYIVVAMGIISHVARYVKFIVGAEILMGCSSREGVAWLLLTYKTRFSFLKVEMDLVGEVIDESGC